MTSKAKEAGAEGREARLLMAQQSGESDVNATADTMKERLFTIGKEIAMQLGKDATLKQFLQELKKQNPSGAYNEEVRAGFDTYRDENDWPKL